MKDQDQDQAEILELNQVPEFRLKNCESHRGAVIGRVLHVAESDRQTCRHDNRWRTSWAETVVGSRSTEDNAFQNVLHFIVPNDNQEPGFDDGEGCGHIM